MSNLSLWCEAVLADFYDKKLNDDPEYVIDKLHKDVNTCRERIAELEKELNEINATLENVLFMNFKGTYIFNIPNSKKVLAKRDLEQQAKGVEDAIVYASFNKLYYIDGVSKIENICATEDLIVHIEKLLQQAKELNQ